MNKSTLQFKSQTGGVLFAGFAFIVLFAVGCASKPFANYNQGILEMNEGEPTAAETHLLEELVERPKNAEAWNQLGIIAFEREHWSAAEERFRAAYDNNTLNPAYSRNLGMTFAAQQQYNAAVEWFDISLALSPNDVETLDALAKTQYLSGDAEASRKTLERLLELEPANSDAQSLLARLPDAPQ
ncbi:tetratricopeptide repeat protein [bacterium]|nr:tetratricopeptide repeat protein [bacterium]